ncbi:unnamed protein product [Mytilus coruscus]|uniref:Uncharacterized protein n=1 Tax=Mytilus coruscus TaxID=42192 RepID=A0A6J8A199_MYTCO|nr:unnamed protein product [Mytilus coruscus]
MTDGISADCSNLGLLNSPFFMKNVISANLSFNFLTSLPDEGLLPAGLKFLDLSSNKISNFSHDGLPPFTTSTTLLSLNLSNNYISLDSKTYFKGVFKNLFDLKILDIFNNSYEIISYYCPDEVFVDLISLESLSIDGVKNVTFGRRFAHLHNLTSLKVAGLAARGTIQKDMFQHFPFIRFLDFSSRTEWRNIEHFAVLIIEQGTIKNLPHLEVLDISYNRRLGLCGFRNVSYDLPFTSIKIFKAQYIACERSGSSWLLTSDVSPLNKTQLLELYIDGNNLDKTETSAVYLLPRSLHVLSITDNRWVIDDYAYFDNLLNLVNLTTVDVSFQNMHQMSHSHNSYRCNNEYLLLNPMKCLCYRLQDKRFLNLNKKNRLLSNRKFLRSTIS